MTDKTKSLLRLCYHVAVTAALAVAGVLLMVACVGIYRLNPDGHPFTREVVAQHFAPIALPVYLCAALAVLGFFRTDIQILRSSIIATKRTICSCASTGSSRV